MNVKRREGTYVLRMGGVEHVSEGAVGSSEERPHREGSFLDVSVLTLLTAVTQERPEQTRVCVLNELHLTTSKQKNSVQVLMTTKENQTIISKSLIL